MGRSRSSAVRNVVVITAVEMLLAVVLLGSSTIGLPGVDVAWPHRALAALALLWLPVQGRALARLVADFRDARVTSADVQDRLHSLALSTHDWLWSIDRDGVITYSSPGCREIFGYEPEELVGREIRTVLHTQASPESLAECAGAIAAGTGWHDLVLHCADRSGANRYVLSSCVPIVDASQSVVGHHGAARLLLDERYQRIYGNEVRRRIKRAMSDDGLSVALQPIVGVQTDRLCGVEALARFYEYPHQSPDRWFSDAAAVGLGRTLELLAVGKAIETMDELPSSIYLSINTSPNTMASPELLQLLRDLGPAARRVVIEITEHESIDDYGAMTAAREELRGLGVRLAVDDAGAGFASFRHILRLRPDIIKLDRGLINGIDGDLARRALATSVVIFSLEVGATVVAEGVETAAELSAVLDLGIDGVQGYHIGRPSRDRREWERWCRPRLQLVGPAAAGTA